MPRKYILNENSQVTGPFTAQDLEQRYRAAEIDGDTFCWPFELAGVFSGNWMHLHTYFRHFQAPKLEQHKRQQQERRPQQGKRLEREKQEHERLEREKQEHERLEREKQEHERLEREKQEHERLEREKQEHERLEREQQERERLERERLEREKQERERLERERLERERQEQERLKREAWENQGIAFDCVDCGTVIRLRLLKSLAVYRCPSCDAEYKTVQPNAKPPVLLVLPGSRRRAPPAAAPQKRKKFLPPEVRSALAAFGLGEEATLDDVRRAYREHLKQYHPDKVAHLGEELRNIADMKTREFNSAHRILARFLAPCAMSPGQQIKPDSSI